MGSSDEKVSLLLLRLLPAKSLVGRLYVATKFIRNLLTMSRRNRERGTHNFVVGARRYGVMGRGDIVNPKSPHPHATNPQHNDGGDMFFSYSIRMDAADFREEGSKI